MTSRRNFITSALTLCFLAWRRDLRADDVASLRDQLRSVLKCRRDLEFEFVNRVADLVEQNQLPRDMVLAVMHYAVRKRPQFPYTWFERGIRIKAEELGVEI